MSKKGKLKNMLKKIFQSNILNNTLFTLGGKIAAMLLYMVLDIACARILSPDDYAEWVFFFTILTMMFYVGWCGINTSAKVFISKESTKEKISQKVKASFLLRLIASTFILCIILVISFPFAKCLGYPEKYPDLYILCMLSGLLVFFNSFSEFFKEVFMGLGEFKKLCAITILEYSGYLLYSLVFLIPIRKVWSVAIGYICSGVIVFLFGMTCLKKFSDSGMFPEKKDIYQPDIKAIFKYAVPIAISSIGGMILVEMDTFMLGILSTKSQVANYGIAKNLCGKAGHINYALIVGGMTSFSVLTMENIKEKRSKLLRICNINILISGIVAGAFLLMGNFFIVTLYGETYGDAAKILGYLVPYYIMNSISVFFGTFLDFQGKANIRSICHCSVMLLNLILNITFIPKLGASGAALATSLSILPYTVLVTIVTIAILKQYNN